MNTKTENVKPEVEVEAQTEAQILIEKLLKANKPFSAIRNALLALDLVKNGKEADKLLAEMQVGKRKQGRGIEARMHSFLAESERSKEELKKWIN